MTGSRRDRLLALAPVLLLCLVAAVQFALTNTVQMAPWKGGGFGMFSTTDSAASRRVRLTAEGPDGSRSIPIPSALQAAAFRAEAFPSEDRLREIGRRAAALETRAGRPVHRVLVEVVRVRHDTEDLAPTTERIREVVVDLPDPGR